MKIKLPRNFPGPTFLVMFFILSLSFASMNAMTQTKKLVLKDFTFYPFTNQTSVEDPMELPYHSKGPLVSITIDECNEYNTIKDFLDMRGSGAKKTGSMTNQGIAWAYAVKAFEENRKYELLTAMVMNNASGAKILVTMRYPANSKASGNNSLTMLNTFKANAGIVKTEPVNMNNPTTDPVNNVPVNNTAVNNTINIQKILDAHNAYRKVLGLPLLTWSADLANYAQKWVNELSTNRNCQMLHRPYDENNPWNLVHGENIFSGSSGYTVLDAVEAWGSEKKDFNPVTKTCNGEWYKCGHYTQMVWKNTTQVGCATVTCANGDMIVVCNYNPGGNVIGEKPY